MKYHLLNGGRAAAAAARPQTLSLTWPISILNHGALPSLVAILLSLTAVFYAGTLYGNPQTSILPQPIALSLSRQTFKYNRTFAISPSFASTSNTTASNDDDNNNNNNKKNSPPNPNPNADPSTQAWKSIFPAKGGYFEHPTIAPQRATFSVFHQLHCLNGMRQGYWFLYDHAVVPTSSSSSSSTSSRNSNDKDNDNDNDNDTSAVTQEQEKERKFLHESEIPFMAGPIHFRHCVDLLRQSLMCRPDLTVEVKDLARGGVTGFGTEHVCLDWRQLVDWVGKWEEPRNNGTKT